MTNYRCLVVGIGALLVSFAACGQDAGGADSRYDIGVFSGFSTGGDFKDALTDETLDLEGGASGGVVMRIPQTSSTYIEVFYSEQSTRTRSNGLFTGDPLFDLKVRYLQIGGVYEIDDALNRPYLMGGMGLTHFEPDGESLEPETRFSMGLGAGYLFPVTRGANLRLEARAVGTLFNTNGELFCTNGRCRITLDSDVLWQAQLSMTFALAF